MEEKGVSAGLREDLLEFERRYRELCEEFDVHIVAEPIPVRVNYEGKVWISIRSQLTVRRRTDGSSTER